MCSTNEMWQCLSSMLFTVSKKIKALCYELGGSIVRLECHLAGVW